MHCLKLECYYTDTFPGHPRGYKENPQCPILRGENHCPYCLCAPCVILLPPDFLRGSAGQHPANDGKRQRLYRMFWRLLSDLGVWRDQEYLARKEARTTEHKKCEMIPRCVITVSVLWNCVYNVITLWLIMFWYRRLDRGIQATLVSIMIMGQNLKQRLTIWAQEFDTASPLLCKQTGSLSENGCM